VTGQPKAGRSIELTKGDQPVTIEKTSRIIASATWDGTANYELYALVLTSSGHEVHVATFPADGIPALLDYGNGAVRHLGDVRRGSHGTKKASLEIRPSLDIVAVVPVIYCAQSNGVGSFARYRVSLLIEEQSGAELIIRSRQPSENWLVFSWVPGIIRNTPNGIEIEALDLYSEARSKNRPKLLIVPNGNVKIEVDAGPINKYM
jgi:tellurite resistance protein TerA